MPTIRNRFYPLHDIDDHNVISLYSTLLTGLAGTLVKIVTGAANPQNADGWSNAPVGAAVANTISYRYETKMKVTPTVSGDTAYNALGLTLYSTLEYDENGIPLRYDDQRAKEIGAVRSGETTPILTKSTTVAIWGSYIDTSLGNIQPGNLVVVSRSGNGLLAAIDPASANFSGVAPGAAFTQFVYNPTHVVGKWLTSLPTATNTGQQNEFGYGTANAQGGYALFMFDTNI